MTKMRRFAAIAAAAAMTACMAMPMSAMFTASAATINVTTDGATASTSTFEAYKLLGATDGGDGKYAYTVNEDYKTILQAATGATEDSAIIAAISGYTAEQMRTFADTVYKAIQAAGMEYDATGTGSITTDTQGYYLVAETALADANTAGTMSLVMVDTLGKDNVTITTKTESPSFQKKLKDANDTEGTETGWQDSADYDIGDKVPFQLKATLPADYANYKEYKLVFHDCLQDGVLSYDADSAKVSHKGTGAVAITPVTSTTCGASSTNGDDCDLEFTVDVKTAFPDAVAGDTIEIEYTATLGEGAKHGSAGNWNAAYLEYSNNPYFDSSLNTDQNPDNDMEETTSETPEDQVVVFTYKTVINKVDGTDGANKGAALAGAAFKLSKLQSDGTYKEVKAFTAGEATSFEFVGLDDGTYKLEETTTPEGYNPIDPIEFKIEATHDEEADTPALKTLTGTKVTGEITLAASTDNSSLTADVENKSGTELPDTGGIGTTIFYVVGGTLVAGAGVTLIAKKRMKKED